jgi:hypothetical protein
MALADKMFSRETRTCPVRSDCRRESNKRYFDSLFDRDWDVFVVKRDNEKNKFDWFTLCCEAAGITNDTRNNCATVGC